MFILDAIRKVILKDDTVDTADNTVGFKINLGIPPGVNCIKWNDDDSILILNVISENKCIELRKWYVALRRGGQIAIIGKKNTPTINLYTIYRNFFKLLKNYQKPNFRSISNNLNIYFHSYGT